MAKAKSKSKPATKKVAPRTARAPEKTKKEKKRPEESAETNVVNGRWLVEALKFVLKACPTGDDNEHLSHIVIGKIKVDPGNFDGLDTVAALISGDSYRWHVAYLPKNVRCNPFAVTRAAARRLMLMIEATIKGGSTGTPVYVTLGSACEIKFGDERNTVEMDKSVVGPIAVFELPVPGDAPIREPRHVLATHLSEATAWKKSSRCSVVWRGADIGPSRGDVFPQGSERTPCATAVILPIGKRAELPSGRQLSLSPRKLTKATDGGSSICALYVSSSERFELMMKDRPEMKDIDTIGVDDLDACLTFHPCAHTKLGDVPSGMTPLGVCIICTADGVRKTQEAMVKEGSLMQVDGKFKLPPDPDKPEKVMN